MPERGIHLDVEGALARITLDRPPLNVIDTTMLRALRAAFEEADRRRDVRLIRLDARGKLFSAGVDVADHVGQRIAPMMEALAELFEALERLATPSVAVVHGAALGGGCELVLATDLCFASEKATFGQPEIRLGLFAPPASVLLPRLVGRRRALELLLSGESVSAREAERMGLVNRVFAHEALETEVEGRLAHLLSLSGEALRLAKRAVALGEAGESGEAQRRVHRLYLDELMRTDDAREGLAAFLDKRPPRWTHR